MAKFGFDTSDIDPTQQAAGGGDRTPVPEGDYTLSCLEAEEKDTSTGGTMIKAKFEVIGGEHNGRWIWQNFNVVNKSETAQRIGRQQLVAWATAAGKPDADDTDKLLGRQFRATVTVEKGTGGYSDSNKIKAFLFDAPGEKPTSKAKAAAPAPAPAPKGAKPANPWD